MSVAQEPEPEDDDDWEEGESSDEDSVPERPLFDLEIPWFQKIGKDSDTRRPYTRDKCIVQVRVTDTVGDLRKRVAEATRLEHFILLADGEELEKPSEEPKEEKGSDEEDEDEEDEEDEEEGEEDEEMDMKIMLAVGAKKDRLIAEKEEKERQRELAKSAPTGDNRTLEMIGLKEPAPKKEKAGGDAAAAEGQDTLKDPDASFLPRPGPNSGAEEAAAAAAGEPTPGGQPSPGNETGANPAVDPNAPALEAGGGGADGAGADGAGADAAGEGGAEGLDASVKAPSVLIELEEFDEPVDGRMFPEPESSAVLLKRAINGINKPWWERAADGNIAVVKELWASCERLDLLQVNWRNPENHNRTAVMACSFRGQIKTLRWLVGEHKARVNGWDDNGCTALNLAARGGYPKVVKFLLENRAKPSVPDSNGWTAAVWALAMGHLDVLQEMANFGVPLEDLGQGVPFDSAHMSPTTLLPLPCVRSRRRSPTTLLPRT